MWQIRWANNGRDNWSECYRYEPLEMVKHGDEYYVARRFVPEGIDIHNKDYWIQTDWEDTLNSIIDDVVIYNRNVIKKCIANGIW